MQKLSKFVLLSSSALLASCVIGMDPEFVPTTGTNLDEASPLPSDGSTTENLYDDEIYEGWTDEIRADMLEYCGIVLPYYDGFIGKIFDYGWMGEEDYYGYVYNGLYIYDETETMHIESSNYGELLISVGFEQYTDEEEGYDYYVLENEDGSLVFVYLYFDEGGEEFEPGNTIEIDYYPVDDDDDTEIDIDPSETLDGDTIDFSTEEYIVDYEADYSMVAWGVGSNYFVLTQGSSSITVGNVSFLADPLRCYKGQTGSFLFLDEVPSSIVVTIKLTSKSKAENFLVDVYATASVGEASDGIVALTIVPNEEVQGFDFEISDGQVHIVSIQFIA